MALTEPVFSTEEWSPELKVCSYQKFQEVVKSVKLSPILISSLVCEIFSECRWIFLVWDTQMLNAAVDQVVNKSWKGLRGLRQRRQKSESMTIRKSLGMGQGMPCTMLWWFVGIISCVLFGLRKLHQKGKWVERPKPLIGERQNDVLTRPFWTYEISSLCMSPIIFLTTDIPFHLARRELSVLLLFNNASQR